MHKEVFRFNCQSLLDMELVAWIIESEVESLQQHGRGENYFLPGKRTTYTTSHPITKRFPAVVWKFAEWLVKHPLRYKRLGIVSVDCGISVDFRKKTYDWLSCLDHILSSRKTYLVACGIRQSLDGDRRCSWCQSQRFPKACFDVW